MIERKELTKKSIRGGLSSSGWWVVQFRLVGCSGWALETNKMVIAILLGVNQNQRKVTKTTQQEEQTMLESKIVA